MPTRVIRDGCLDSERVDALSEMAELFYKRLWMIVDDYGRFEYEPVVILARVFPRRVNRYTAEQVQDWIKECCKGENPLVIIYKVARKSYLEVQDFGQRIRLNKDGIEVSPSRHPYPPGKVLFDYLPHSAAKRGETPQAAARASDTTTPSTTPSLVLSSEESLRETRKIFSIRPVETDEAFSEWEALARSVGMLGSEGPDGDWHRARTVFWPKMTFEDQLRLLTLFRERIANGNYADPHYVPGVVSFFESKWRSPVRPKARDSPKEKTAKELHKELLAKRYGGGDGETASL